MTGRPKPLVIVADRREGKTRDLVTWLLGGRKITGYPGWSRVLVVADRDRCRAILRDFPDVQHALHEAGTGGLGKLVMHLAEAARALRRAGEVEIALDDAHLVLWQALHGLTPTVLAMTGEPVPVGELAGSIR